MDKMPDDIWNKIIKAEGAEYTDDPVDRGGKTKYGISQKRYPNLDIKNLTEAWKGKKIVQLSDLHLGSIYGKGFLEKIVQKIQYTQSIRFNPGLKTIPG